MKRTGLVITLVGIIVLALLALTPAIGQAASFLKIDGVVGESRDAYHPGWIDVTSYRWLTPVPPVKVGGSAQGGEGSLVVTKRADMASTMLSTAASSKAPYPTVVLTFPSTSNPLQYLKYTLSNVLITSITTGGSGGEDRLTENVTLNFSGFRVQYTSSDGTPVKPSGLTISPY